MRRSAFIAALGVLLFSASVSAHTHLAKSDPADGSVLTRAPERVTLQFEHAVRVTALDIQKGDGKSEKLLGSLPETASEKISAAPGKLGDGAYAVSWRAVSADGHVMSGKVRFTIATAGKAGDSAASH
jgi:methionine-rich copper-binding protein CopC